MDNAPSGKEIRRERLLRWSKGILTAAGALLLFLLLSVAVSFLYSFICLAQGISDPGEITGLVSKNALLLNLVVNVFVIMFLLLFSLTKQGNPVKRLRIYSINPAKIFGFILFGICLNVLFSLGFSLIPFPDTWIEAQNEAYESYYSNIFMAVISVGLATGVAEELLFRAAVISPLRSAFGRIPALIISSLVFSLFHTSIIAKIYSLILGILLGLFFLRYDSVVPPILIHASFNCTSFVLGILDNAKREFVIIICVISAIVIVRMFVWLYVRYPGFSDVLFDRGERLRPEDPEKQVIYDRIRELREGEEEVDSKELEELNEQWEDLRKSGKKRESIEPEGPRDEKASPAEDVSPLQDMPPEDPGKETGSPSDAPEVPGDDGSNNNEEGENDDKTV